MIHTRSPLIWSALAAVLLWGCANPVSWENDIHVPVLDDRVTWADVVPDTLYEPGVDGGPAHFVLVDTLDGWDWGEWTTLPDTTISVRYDGEGVLENGVPVQGIPVALSDDDVPVLEISLSQPEGWSSRRSTWLPDRCCSKCSTAFSATSTWCIPFRG